MKDQKQTKRWSDGLFKPLHWKDFEQWFVPLLGWSLNMYIKMIHLQTQMRRQQNQGPLNTALKKTTWRQWFDETILPSKQQQMNHSKHEALLRIFQQLIFSDTPDFTLWPVSACFLYEHLCRSVPPLYPIPSIPAENLFFAFGQEKLFIFWILVSVSSEAPALKWTWG